MKTFPLLETSRLTLRQPLETDIDFIFSQRSSPEVNKFIKRERAKTRRDAELHFEKISKNFIDKTAIAWSICLKDDPSMIGAISLWNFSMDRKTAELGYDLHPDFQNKGYMTEAIAPVLHHGFYVMNFETIEAFTNRRNESSKRILIKNLFVHAPDRKDEGNEDNWIFSITKTSLSSPSS